MKAVRIHCFGDAGVLGEEETARPEPQSGELLIRVHAAGVNPIDAKIRAGKFRKTEIDLPAILGRDVSGVVEAVGADVTRFRPGDEVFAFLGSHSGGYAEFAVAKEHEVAPKPKSIDHAHAAAVPLAAITAWQALFDHGRLEEGQQVLIHGAAGGVGHYAVQLAKARGARVVATGRQGDLEFLRDLGADEVVDSRDERFEDRVRDVDLVLDLVGGETQLRSWVVLKRRGRLVSTLEEPSRELAERHGAEGILFMAQPDAEQLREIGRLIDEGNVRVQLQKLVPLDEAAQAHEVLEHEHSQGKVVLMVQLDENGRMPPTAS